MLKYRGQYRVSYEMDKLGKPSEFTFIPCRIKKGSNIYRYNNEVLAAYIPSMQIVRRLHLEYSHLFRPFQTGDKEGTLLFNESNLPEVVFILKIKVKGCNVSPRSKRNIRLA